MARMKDGNIHRMYYMKLHNRITLKDGTEVYRVPGGWIYRLLTEEVTGGLHINTQFIPFDKEFMEQYHKGITTGLP